MRHNNGIIELSLKTKDFSPEKNSTFQAVKQIHFANLEKTLKENNYSFIQWKNNIRKNDNFMSATGFVVDIDEGLTIEQAKEKLNFRNINYALITSKRHAENAHRFHILIPFNRKVFTIENYKKTIEKIQTEIFPQLDPNTCDAARFIFGSNTNAIYYDCFSNSNFNIDQNKYVDSAWDDNTTLKLANGKAVFAKELALSHNEKEPIYCPFHNDNNASAFVGYTENSLNYFIYCSSCNKTYWKVQDEDELIEKRMQHFWSQGQSVFEAGIVSDVFSLESIGEKKFYIKVGAHSKDDKNKYYAHLVNHKHFHRLQSIDYLPSPEVVKSDYTFSKEDGVITVKIKSLPIKIKDNQFIEDYFDKTFGSYKSFIKKWLACYVYSNYKKLPTLIIIGKRGVGKNTFAETIQAIYPTLSETVKNLEDNFNGFAEKKLLMIDEAASNGKVQYQMLKKFSGQKYISINKKYSPEYQVRNNLNIVFLSNDEMPIYVEREEMPTDENNNQFFVFRMQPHESFDANLQDKLIDRLGHYIRTELKTIFDSLNLNISRYSISVPITDEEKRLFNNSLTKIDSESDHIIEILEEKIIDNTWQYFPFIQRYLIPSSFFDQLYFGNIDKIKVIQNLQKRGYLSAEKAARYNQINGKRPYSYKLGPVLIEQIKNQLSV